MKSLLRKDNTMELHTGYLGTSRVVLNHFDVSTQADIQHTALAYESEDEIMGRLYGSKERRAKPAHYSKQDIREQYCISDRGLGALENDKQSLFGCLSTHQGSPCSPRSNFLTACVRQKVPSDENLYELHKRHPSEYAPYPRRSRYPWAPAAPDMCRYDQEFKSSYFRRKANTDPSRYTWMPSDDESVRMEKPRSILEQSYQMNQVGGPPSVLPGKKHVSFARSHTLTSFDDAMSSLSSSSSHLNRMTKSQERLLDVRKSEPQPITKQPEPSENILILDKIKRTPMKTQATQTEAALGRKPIPPGHINLSPRTIHRVKMVSQGAQTNGIINLNGRKLTKSFSEAGSKFGQPSQDFSQFETILDHEPLQRTQSDEPPRSPFLVTTPPPILPPPDIPTVPSDTSSLSRSDEHESEDSVESKKEIFIDFKPQLSTGKMPKRPLTKTASDGAILIDQRKSQKIDDSVVPEKPLTSLSHENIIVEDEQQRSFTPYFQKSPIRNEGICKPLEDNIYSSVDNGYGQDSIDEEFHENLIYNKMYIETQDSIELAKNGRSPIDECVVPSVCLMPDRRLSPFASNDSLANDARDQSDGIWNESQVTVLQVDSGTDNGTALSSSEMTSVASPGSATLLTPSSRRKHLLMLQHQQRSSMDTETLDEEFIEQETFPRIVVERSTKLELPSPVQSKHYLSSQRNISPIWKRKVPESPSESPQPAVVPDLLLARTDSGKTNTDVSESTTTDDYITANSGTDSSRKSGSIKGIDIYNFHAHINNNEGSSFESSTKGSLDIFVDDMVVPSFSPPPPQLTDHARVHNETHQSASRTQPSPVPCVTLRSPCITPVPQIRTGRSTPSEDSSSCGSYSVGTSTPDLLDRFPVPSESPNKTWQPCGSDDEERSIHYSSSGYYESPMEDDYTWKSPRHRETPVQKKRREFHLDLTANVKSHHETYATTNNGKHKIHKLNKLSPSSESLKMPGEKPKRSKSRTRSPMQGYKKNFQSRKTSPYREKSPYPEERESKITSDESSCDFNKDYMSNQVSPRKSKKTKENNRRKSLPRSPTSQKSQKKNGSDDKPSSLPGSLNRRKSSRQNKSLHPDNTSDHHLVSSRSSPIGKKHHSPQKSPDTTKLKALSAESLRSVSPGSDSVFYSDPSSHAAADHQVHCLHCGKEVDIVTTDDPDKSVSSNSHQQDIVQPPAGFEDSPILKPTGRLYKKVDRRIKSEERSQAEHRRHRYKPDVRAKSEERGAKTYRSKLRPMAKSTNNSQEQLKSTDSSPSVLPAAPEDEDDYGIYDASYNEGSWIYVDERDEVITTNAYLSPTEQEPIRRDSISSTESEQDFRKKYQAVTHRMVHRKSCLEMYKRQNSKSFDCDKTVIVHRESGEFGFRIHGSKPVVVSAIEPGTPAESSGLEVGDIVLAVNGVSVLDKSHSEVVKIAHAGSDTLKLEVARTCYALNTTQEDHTVSTALFSGYLWKLSGYASGTTTNKWIRRWFCLKQNNCLYYYKTDTEKQPVGVVMLFDHEVHKLNDDDGGLSKPNRFVIQRPDAVPLHLAGDTSNARNRWVEVIGKAIVDSQTVDEFLEETKRNMVVAPSAIQNPDCFGYLVKLGNQWKSWSRRYCVLKDACLYFYQDANAKSAFGVTYLHGYRVQQSSGSKKHAFDLIPPDPSKKHYYFHTESETDRKRWIAAVEYSIDRWLKIQ